MHRKRLVGVVLLVLLLGTVLAACGDDDDTTAGNTGATTETTAASGGGASFTLEEPMSVLLLAEKKGESPAAIPEYYEAATLAIEDLNAAGGVGGKDVAFEQIPAPLDPAKANAALLQAVDKDPTVIVGFPASAQVVAIGPTVERSGIPTFFISTAGANKNQKWGFSIRPRNASAAADVATYAVKELGAKKIGLICVNNPFGTQGCAGAKDAATKAGAQIVAERTNEATATDMTEQVLAMKSAGADAVLDFNFPNPLGVAANQMVDNGLDTPHLDGASSEIAVLSGAVKGKAAEKLYGVDDCWPKADTRKIAQDFVAKYQQKFGHLPNYAAAEVYDAIMLSAKAVEEAKSTDHDKVQQAIKGMEYEGICDPAYKSDSEQVLNHVSVIVNFPGGEPTIVKKLEVPDPNA